MTRSASSESVATCPICGDPASWSIPFFDEESGETIKRSSGYHWRLCRQCGTAYPFPAPSLPELQAYWNRNRVEGDTAPVTEAVWQWRLQASRVWAQRTYDFVLPHVRSKTRRFLDIACGLGATVALFGEKGWKAEGVDADPNVWQFHERLGIKTTIGQIECLNSFGEYNLIAISHAIYFIGDPKGFVQRVKSLLSNDGLFLVTLSDLMSVFCDGKPQYVHTWYPTQESLSYLLEQEGFKILGTHAISGSIMVLAKLQTLQDRQTPKSHPYWVYARFLSHSLRYKLVGLPLIKTARIIKKILR